MTEILVPVSIMAALIALNGLFVAAEFAIVGAPRATIDHWAARGDRLARRVKRILDDPQRQDRYLATAQIGITVASLGLGMYGEHILAAWLARALDRFGDYRWLAAHAVASALSVTILTYFHIVAGEMVPKALALQHAAGTARLITPAMLVIQRVILPLVVGLNKAGNALLHVAGIQRRAGAERYHTSEDLEFIIEESQHGGALRGESGALLREVFELGDLTAGEVMMPRVSVVGIPAETPPDQLRGIVRRTRYTRYPVYVESLDTIIGSLHIKEVLRHLVANQPVTAQDARPLPYVPQTAPLADVLAAMRRFRTHMVVVMDEYGGTAGVVTIEDLFEEMVGEIEEGRGQLPIVPDAEGALCVRGTVRVKELSDAFGTVVDYPAVSTVSGLVLALLGRPAVPGDVVTWSGVRIEVTSVAHRGVNEARITPEVSHPPGDSGHRQA
jgi:CBS domain containing-hemolysin-like protein